MNKKTAVVAIPVEKLLQELTNKESHKNLWKELAIQHCYVQRE